jgi:hypothetical protein
MSLTSSLLVLGALSYLVAALLAKHALDYREVAVEEDGSAAEAQEPDRLDGAAAASSLLADEEAASMHGDWQRPEAEQSEQHAGTSGGEEAERLGVDGGGFVDEELPASQSHSLLPKQAERSS